MIARYAVRTCRGVLRTYRSALEPAPHPRRRSNTCSIVGTTPLWSFHFGGNAVHTTPSRLRCAAQLPTRSATSPSVRSALDQYPTYRDTVPSLRRRASRASHKPTTLSSAQRVRTGWALDSKTRLIPLLLDWRAYSTGSHGPSSFQGSRTGRVRGSQISEPQPKQTTLIVPAV